MFAVAAVILLLGNFVFVFFAKFEIQPWNGEHDPKIHGNIDRRASAFSRCSSFDLWDVHIDSWKGVHFANGPSVDFDPRVKSVVIRDERFDPRGNVFGPPRRGSLSSRRSSVSSI